MNRFREVVSGRAARTLGLPGVRERAALSEVVVIVGRLLVVKKAGEDRLILYTRFQKLATASAR